MPTPTDLLISEYIEGSSFNKAIELFNGTGSPIDLSEYFLVLYSNGNTTATGSLQLSGTLADGEVLVLAHPSADASILAEADVTNGTVINFNGDDAVVLRKGSATGTVIDSIGQIGFDPGSEWGTGLVSTADNTLRLQSDVFAGDTDSGDVFAPADRFEGFANGTFDGLGSHSFTGGEAEPGVTIVQSGGATSVTEGGATDTFTVVLDTEPTADVTISVTADAETTLSTASLTFTPANWNVPQEVTVTAVDDATNETPDLHASTIGFSAASADADYDAIAIDPVDAEVQDSQLDVTLISTVQGEGAASELEGQIVTVEAIVVGDFQSGDETASVGGDGETYEPRDIGGFYIQEEITDSDGNVVTSEGIFVYDPDFRLDVEIGDRVRITGRVDEYFGETQINVGNAVSGAAVTLVEAGAVSDVGTMAATIDLPSAGTTLSQNGDVQPDLEAYEGMLVTIPETLTVVEQFQLDRFNEIKLFAAEGFEQSIDGETVTGARPFQYTQYNDPDAAGYADYLNEIGARTITYDDGLNEQNANISNLDGFQGYSTETAPRMGDTVTGLTGVLDYKWAGNSTSGSTWRVRSVEDGANSFDDSGNDRPAESVEVGGSVKVASFNVLNFFTTLDTSGTSTELGQDPRGADNAAEFERQLDKTVEAIRGLNADIVGLLEIENDFMDVDPEEPAIQTLVDALNAAEGSDVWAFVDPGQDYVGSDAIATAMIYRTDRVEIADGTSPSILTDAAVDQAILDRSTVDNDAGAAGGNVFDGPDTSRASLAATFETIAGEEELTVVVNHFKSKGGDDADTSGGDADAGDGAGYYNNQRLLAAEALDAWLATNPTGSTSGNVMLIGDFNAYAEEAPIDYLTEVAGYVDLAAAFLDMAYSYVFDGLVGTLDYAFASLELFEKVVEVIEWQINADEADALDYNTDFGRDPSYFDGEVPYRSSDHDPILVGLDLDGDVVSPVLTGSNPADDSTEVSPDTNIVLTFDETVMAGAGDITLSNGAGDTRTFSVLDPQVSFADNVVTIDLDADLVDGTTYDVTIAEGAIVDAAGNEFAGLLEDDLDFGVGSGSDGTFTLQILHASDFEAGLNAIDRAGNFAAIVDYLEETYENSITLSSGDNYLPSPFFNAGGDPSLKEVYETALETHYGLAAGSLNISPAVGFADISILNIIGIEASTIGNHEFDAGTSPFASLIRQSATYPGAQFPYLSANLDFSGDPNLSGLYTSVIRDAEDYAGFPPAAGNGTKIAPATIINENGERIGVVGATTQIVESISSTGGVEVIGDDIDDMAELAAILQPTIDALIADGVNKIIVASHLQQLALEQELATHLEGVDIIVAGGSHTLLADDQDVLRTGDTAAGEYPIVTTGADGKTTLIVNTSSEYSYVGRLVVTFDENGDVILDSLDPDVSGAFATTDEVVADLYEGNTTVDVDADGDIDADDQDAFAEGGRGDLVTDITDGVAAVIEAQDGNLFGSSAVYLEGRREEVRTQETNLGNLSADANLWYAQLVDETVLVSIKNGGGIRDSIGRVEAVGGDAQELPPAANPDAGKEEGDVSQLDISNSLRFNNALSLITVTAAQLLQVLEHAVAASTATNTPGQFAQIGGIAYSYDIDLPSGNRVVSAALIDENGEPTMALVEDGELVVDPAMAIRLVTLSFLVGGGDNYPFDDFVAADPAFADVVDLDPALVPDAGQVADFAAEGTEQDALAEFLAEFFTDTPYADEDTDRTGDERIQNLDFREDTVLADLEDQVFVGGAENDAFTGGAGDDIFAGGDGMDTLIGKNGDDIFVLGADIDDAGSLGPSQIELGDGSLVDLPLDGLAGTMDSVDGGAGTDTVVLTREESDGYVYDARSAPETISGIERILGTDGGDVILLAADYETDGGMVTILGMEGDDAIGGSGGGDHLNGGEGDDLLSGLGGDDTIVGGGGDDEAHGGDGSDTFTYGEGEGDDHIHEGPGQEGDFDRLVLQNLSFASARFYKHGDDVQVVFDEGSITLHDQLLDDGSGVEEVSAEEGTIDRDQLEQLLENRGPVAADDALGAVQEDADAFVIAFAELLGNDSDEDLDDLAVSAVTSVEGGTVEIVEDGVRFTPAENFNGTASFTYEVSDGRGGFATATASFEVEAVNDAPTIVSPISLSTDEDEAVNGQVEAEDVDGDALTYTLSEEDGPDFGQVVVNGDGSFTYTPNENANGSDSFTILVSDGTETVETVVNVEVAPVNDAPVTQPDSGVAGENETKLFDVLANDIGPDGDTLSITGLAVTGISGIDLDSGAAAAAFSVEDDQIRFDPGTLFDGLDEGESATVTVEYTATDGEFSTTETFTLTVEGAGEFNEITGSDGRNFLFGTNGDDMIDALGSSDTVLALGGNDVLLGGSGNDIMLAGAGDDELYGQEGADTLFGGSGDDLLVGGAGNDLLFGEGGSDTFVFKPGDGRDSVFGFQAGAGAGDVIELDAGEFADFDDLMAAGAVTNSFLGARIAYDDGSSLTLFGVNAANLAADDFAFS